MSFYIKDHFKIILFTLFLILSGCKLKENSNKHGIIYLENRSKQLIVNKSNTNDAIKIIGNPHYKSIGDELTWFYLERVLVKGEFHKLGQNILKENNILVLNFDKYGILKDKQFLDKTYKEKIQFSENETKNDLSKRSFVESFLSSLKEKMYGSRKK